MRGVCDLWRSGGPEGVGVHAHCFANTTIVPTGFCFLRTHDHISTVYTKFIATYLNTLLVANTFLSWGGFSKRPSILSVVSITHELMRYFFLHLSSPLRLAMARHP